MDFYLWYWLFAVVISILYVALMLWLIVGWNKIKYFAANKNAYATKVAVIVPFQNEQDTIASCLKQLADQQIQTTEYEIIAVNDNSTDNSPELVKKLADNYNRLTFLNATGKGKKAAIMQAVNECNAQLIVTTDADCEYPNSWLATIVDYYETYKPRMIIGTVFMKTGKGILNWFQQLEFNSLIMTSAGAAGIGHPIMCNGANLAFDKKAFIALDNPLKEEYISGDDVFLLHNLKKENAEDIHFVKSHSAAVTTKGQRKLNGFVQQRQRWISKANGYSDGDTVFTAGVVFLISLIMVVGLLMLFVSLHFVKPLLFLFVCKTVIDVLFFNQTNNYFHHGKYLPFIPFFELVYSVYVSYIGISGILSSKKWKA